MKPNRWVIIPAAIAHGLAWVVYVPLAIVLVSWPTQQGRGGEDLKVLATVFMPVALTGLGFLTTVISGRGAERKPVYWVWLALLTVFCGLGIFSLSQIHLPLQIKVVVGLVIGLFPIILLVTTREAISVLLLWIAAVLLLLFCGLAMFSVGIFYVPTALALIASAIIFSFKAKREVA